MKISKQSQEWLEWVLITSVPLRRLDSEDLPIGDASGCLVDYAGRRFLLSVRHAVGPDSDGWVIDLGYEPGRGTAIYRPHGFNYVAEMMRGSGVTRHIDFCYTEIPTDIISLYQHVTPLGILDERPRHIFQTDFSATPNPLEVFAFSGQVKPELHGSAAIVTEMNVYPGLRFLRSEGEFHIFELPVRHPGHSQFVGCSGAPIVDTKKNVVALVCSGDSAENTITGVSLTRYRFAFDFLCTDQSA